MRSLLLPLHFVWICYSYIYLFSMMPSRRRRMMMMIAWDEIPLRLSMMSPVFTVCIGFGRTLLLVGDDYSFRAKLKYFCFWIFNRLHWREHWYASIGAHWQQGRRDILMRLIWHSRPSFHWYYEDGATTTTHIPSRAPLPHAGDRMPARRFTW